jgi:predicted nucleic acid-binding protein
MRLIDTSAWVEWLIGSPTGESVAPVLPERSEWLTPTIVQLELAKWLTREAGEERADQVIAFSQLCVVAPLDSEIALSAAEICGRLKLATADAIVYATALKHAADLVTCDGHFDGLPGVIYLPKAGARPSA